MKDDLMRRISDALSAEGGLDSDAELRAELEGDADALAYAQDLVRIDEVLRSFGEPAREPDWDALAARIEARLDEDIEDIGDVAAPPRFADDARDEARAPEVSQEVPVAAPPKAERAPANVVDLAARRRARGFVWLGGIAAAAAVGLGITFGMTTMGEPSADFAAAPSAPMEEQAALEVPAEGAAWDSTAEPAQTAAPTALPAAAAAQPMVGAAPAMPMLAQGEAAPVPEPAPAPRRYAVRGASVDDMLDPFAASAASGGGGGMAAPSRPSRADVLAAIRGVEPSVQRCLAARGQTAEASIQIGADGSIVSVRVSPPYVGSEAQCIVEAVRAAHMPPSAEDYQLVHVFRPAPVAGTQATRPAAAARHRAPAADRATTTEAREP